MSGEVRYSISGLRIIVQRSDPESCLYSIAEVHPQICLAYGCKKMWHALECSGFDGIDHCCLR